MGRCVKKWNLNPIWADMKHPFRELAGGIDALPTPETESSDERTAYPNRRGRGRRRGRLMSVGRSLLDEEVETSSLGNGTSLRRSLARPFREPASRQRLLQRPTATRDRNQSQFAPCCPPLSPSSPSRGRRAPPQPQPGPDSVHSIHPHVTALA